MRGHRSPSVLIASLAILLVSGCAVSAANKPSLSNWKSGDSISPKDDPASWLFILEANTQWTLILQPHIKGGTTNSQELGAANSWDASRSSKLEGKTVSTRSDSTSSFSPRSKQRANSESNEGRTANKVEKAEDGSSNQLIFEGNTDDAPLVERPGQRPKTTPSKPSAPVS